MLFNVLHLRIKTVVINLFMLGHSAISIRL